MRGAKLIVINITDINHLKLVKDFDKDLYSRLILENDKLEYMLDVIENKFYASLKDNKIINFVRVEEEKDTKTARIYPIIRAYQKDLINNIFYDIVLNDGMEVVFTFIDKNDNKLINDLVQDSFLPISDVGDEVCTLVKEKNIEKESSIAWK